jgi:hypothetical protein
MRSKLWLAGLAAAVMLAAAGWVVAQPSQEPPTQPTTSTQDGGSPAGGVDFPLGLLITATGALGIAAFGVVEGFKWTRIGNAGIGRIEKLGPLLDSLENAYGPDYLDLVRSQYKGDQQELRRTLRQGVRISLRPDNAVKLAEYVGVPSEPCELKRVADRLDAGKMDEENADPDRRILARFETAVDTRIDAALTQAQSTYQGKMRIYASVVALAIALGTAFSLAGQGYDLWPTLGKALLVGLAAVPVAPVAKDLVTAIQSASAAIRGRK